MGNPCQPVSWCSREVLAREAGASGVPGQGHCHPPHGTSGPVSPSGPGGSCQVAGARLPAGHHEPLSRVLDEEPGGDRRQLWAPSPCGPHTPEPHVNVEVQRGSASKTCTECRGARSVVSALRNVWKRIWPLGSAACGKHRPSAGGPRPGVRGGGSPSGRSTFSGAGAAQTPQKKGRRLWDAPSSVLRHVRPPGT